MCDGQKDLREIYYLRLNRINEFSCNDARNHCQICFLTMSQYQIQPCPPLCNNDADQDSTQQEVTTKASIKRQQRYREKQRQYVDRLESSVKCLRIEVDKRLIARHKAQVRFQEYLSGMSFQSGAMQASDILSCMREYVMVFESGNRDQQANFLVSATCSQVRFEDRIGRDFLLQYWTNFAYFFSDFSLEKCEYNVDCLNQDVKVGRVSAMLVIRPPCQLWTNIFPHTLSNKRLRDRILQTSTVRLPLTVVFHFDMHGKVSRYNPTIDFVAGLFTAIRNYQDVASMLETANIDASGHIRGNVLPLEMLQADSNFCGNKSCSNRIEADASCRRFTATHKFAMSFLLSSDAENQR